MPAPMCELRSGKELHAAAESITILVVEDHPGTRALVVALLRSAFPGCQLLEADSAEKALPLFEVKAPKLVVMDIALPGMNGIEATQRIKASHPDTLVVMHSSSDLPIYREEATAVGASAFVGKGRTSGGLIPVIADLLPGVAKTA
ncbi:MAG: response regulator transcription factor [Betaproteobacteria bacterium]